MELFDVGHELAALLELEQQLVEGVVLLHVGEVVAQFVHFLLLLASEHL